MTGSLGTMTWLAAVYSVVLLGVAYGIDLMARRASKKVEETTAGGFVYHEDHDAWLCPEDQWLWPQSFDPENRVMRYRGTPSICNSCPVKDTCTTSSDGREVRRMVDSWPASETARFHRGIACAVTVLAVTWPAATALSRPDWVETALLLGVALVVAAASLPLWSHLRRSPADPGGAFVPVRTLDQNVLERTQAAQTHLRRRTTYASDRRPGDQAREVGR